MKNYKYVMADILTSEQEVALRDYIESNEITIIGRDNFKIKTTGKEYGYRSASVDLLAGHSCPAANLCHSRVIENSGHKTIVDYGDFRCYATKSEAIYTAVYDLHKRNFEETTRLDSFPLIMTYIIRSKKLTLIRIHSSGDMYDFTYFKKWIQIAQWNPSVVFFGYSKQATFIKYLIDNPVDNFKMVYSIGGIHDTYAIKHNLPSCTVVTDDYLYSAHNVTITDNHDGTYTYQYVIGKKRGKPVYRYHTSDIYLEYGTFYNHHKGTVENLSCLHDTRRSKVDDFERIMRLESFGIIFH